MFAKAVKLELLARPLQKVLSWNWPATRHIHEIVDQVANLVQEKRFEGRFESNSTK